MQISKTGFKSTLFRDYCAVTELGSGIQSSTLIKGSVKKINFLHFFGYDKLLPTSA